MRWVGLQVLALLLAPVTGLAAGSWAPWAASDSQAGTTTYTFSGHHANAFNRPRSITLPGGGTIGRTFNGRGELTQQTLAFGPQSGTQTFSYDGLGRMRSSAEGGVTVHFDYAIGRVTTRLDSGLRWGTTFDAGAPAASQYPSGTVVVHERGGAQRLQRLIADGTLLARVQDYAQLDAPGTVHIGDAEQIERRDVYDHRRRLLGRSYQVNGRSVADLRYAYDDADREVARQHLHRGGVTDFFSYDADSRLTGADLGARPAMGATSSPWSLVVGGAGWSSGHFSRSYGYDSSGLDLLLQVTSHSVAGDPTPTPSVVAQRGSPNGMSFLADADGFMREVDALGNVTRIQTAGQDTELEYDALSRLRVVRRGNLTIQYQWRADGPLYRRTATCTPAGAGCTASDRLYLYDGMLLLEEQDAASGAVLARYYYAEEGDIPIGADLRPSLSAPLARYYYVVDRQGSVMMLLDEAGDPVEEVLYDPYGAPVVQPADDQLAEVYRVTLDGTDLVVAFTEPVVTTPVVPTSTTPEVVGFGGVASHFVVTQAGTPVAFQARFVDTEPGYQRGTVFRLTPSTAWNPALGYRLRIPAGSFRDLSNNGNQAFTLDFAGAAGVYWFGVAQGTTRPAPRVDSIVGNNLLFQSHLVDNDTGLYLARARVLDPRTGSFLSVDPELYRDSVNRYAAFAHNPVGNRDPTGRAVPAVIGLCLANPACRVAVGTASGALLGGAWNVARQVAGMIDDPSRKFSGSDVLNASAEGAAFGAALSLLSPTAASSILAGSAALSTVSAIDNVRQGNVATAVVDLAGAGLAGFGARQLAPALIPESAPQFRNSGLSPAVSSSLDGAALKPPGVGTPISRLPRFSSAELQCGIEKVHRAEFGNGGGGIPMTVTQQGQTIVVSQVGKKPGPLAREMAKFAFGEDVQFAAGTTRGNAPGLRGGDAEARGLNYLGDRAQGCTQASTHYSCSYCEARQTALGVVNVTGSASENGGKIGRPFWIDEVE